METSQIKKPFITIIVMYCIWVGMCAIIVTLIAGSIKANLDLGGNADVASIVGILLASTFGFGVAGLGIVLSAVGISMGEKKPEMAKGFGIANFVFVMSCLGTMIAGAILLADGLADNIACSIDMGESAAWRANCADDIIRNIVQIICMLVIAGIAVIGIVSSVKIVSTINKTVPRTGFVSAPAGSQPPVAATVAATGSKGKFCSTCGAANEPDAKFCKKCGAAC
jgi:ribosomal protein L40E